MLVFLTLLYAGLLFVLTKTGKVPNTSATWLTLIPYELVLLIGFFIPMQWGAPSGPAVVYSYMVPVTPNVAGEIIDVPVEPNVALSEGDVLFRIDPTPYQAAVDGLQAQLRLAELRLEQSRALAADDAGSEYEVQAYEAQVDGLRAQLDAAQYNLRETTVRAPSTGYVTNVTLRPGMRASNLPLYRAMAFVDTAESGVIAQIHQIYARYIEPGQEVEVAFKTKPGRVYKGKVRFLIPATAQGQAQVTGAAVQPMANVAPGPFSVRIDMDDPTLDLQPGTVAKVAIYTTKTKAAHVIRRVMIRMDAIMNFIRPA